MAARPSINSTVPVPASTSAKPPVPIPGGGVGGSGASGSGSGAPSSAAAVRAAMFGGPPTSTAGTGAAGAGAKPTTGAGAGAGGAGPAQSSSAAAAAAKAAKDASDAAAALAAARAARRARKAAALAAAKEAAAAAGPGAAPINPFDKHKTPGYVLPTINPNALQRFVLYETKSRFYLVGSNRAQTRFRVLKLDRTDAANNELSVVVDPTVYNSQQIHQMLSMLKHQTTKATTAYGIIGFIRFVQGYYVHLITAVRQVASFGGHLIYSIESTELIPLTPPPEIYESMLAAKHPKPILKKIKAAEARYKTLYQVMDLTKDFYFSYTYDLTHSLQHNMVNATRGISPHPTPTPNSHPAAPPPTTTSAAASSGGSGTASSAALNDEKKQSSSPLTAAAPTPTAASAPAPAPAPVQGPKSMYVWNQFLLSHFEFLIGGDREWSTRLIHGFIEQQRCSVWGRELVLTLISRRSRFFAGTRYLKRGINDAGHVANDVETEQILHDRVNGVCGDSVEGSYTAHVQLRASIPLFWTQESNAMIAKPAIVVQKVDPLHVTTRLHFEDLFKRYGAPVLALNLVKQHEKRARETVIGGRFGEAVTFINEFLPQAHKIDYHAYVLFYYIEAALCRCVVGGSDFFGLY